MSVSKRRSCYLLLVVLSDLLAATSALVYGGSSTLSPAAFLFRLVCYFPKLSYSEHQTIVEHRRYVLYSRAHVRRCRTWRDSNVWGGTSFFLSLSIDNFPRVVLSQQPRSPATRILLRGRLFALPNTLHTGVNNCPSGSRKPSERTIVRSKSRIDRARLGDPVSISKSRLFA